MRVSTQQSYNTMTTNFTDMSGQLQHVMAQMATGQRILLPSDDPIAATRITQLNRQQASIEQYQGNIDSVSASLSQQESILDGVNNDMLAIRDDLLQAANGTNSAESLASIGQDVQSMTDAMVNALNYQDGDGNYIFGGTVNDKPPIVEQDTDGDGAPDTYVYQGNNEHRTATVSNGVEVDTNVSVGEIMGQNLDLLNDLNSLSQEMQDPNLDPSDPQLQSDIQSTIDQIDETSTSLNSAIGSMGETQNTISMLNDAQSSVSMTNDALIGQLGDLDYGPASITFTGLEMAMEATMKTYSKVSDLNLFSVV
ncbi:flagellar hook-associated protein FlgL [Scandinavium goeteborgense]|uniref:flagellar hook-associated protein FlgL n=1 Tax=Scandinavium goeteborgense TaxID=1851514 RepID=UPI0021663EBD|nr:flagellar hook-associated protein FlgL [Scandinavium goeteborgense]MCS2153270.1 flagellar hook-associated protein FlgL [Scandinavium goeteborgense]